MYEHIPYTRTFLGDLMNRKITALATSTAALILMAGCSGPTPAPGSYEGVEDLKNAFVDAGGNCPDWDQHDKGQLSLESGSCGKSSALSYFGENTEAIDTTRETFDLLEIPYIVGQSWIIQTSDVDGVEGGHRMADELGGELINESEL